MWDMKVASCSSTIEKAETAHLLAVPCRHDDGIVEFFLHLSPIQTDERVAAELIDVFDVQIVEPFYITTDSHAGNAVRILINHCQNRLYWNCAVLPEKMSPLVLYDPEGIGHPCVVQPYVMVLDDYQDLSDQEACWISWPTLQAEDAYRLPGREGKAGWLGKTMQEMQAAFLQHSVIRRSDF